MQGTDFQSRAGQRALNLHEAAGIERDDSIRAGAKDGIDFAARHGAGKLVELDRESAAESAALAGRLQFSQLQALHAREQTTRGVVNGELAERVPPRARGWPDRRETTPQNGA